MPRSNFRPKQPKQIETTETVGVVMPREVEIQGKPCRSCGQLLAQEARVCVCGQITDTATFKERSEFEVKQWRAYKESAKASASA